MSLYKIDLLKGSGLPPKSSPIRVALAAMPFILPVLIAAFLIVQYCFNSAVLATEKTTLDRMNSVIAESSDLLATYTKSNEEFLKNSQSWKEVSSELSLHIQWSGVVKTVVEKMPESVILTKLTLKRDAARKKIPDKLNPDNTVMVTIINRILKITVCGMMPEKSDQDVQEFLDLLRASDEFRNIIDDIRIAAKNDETINEKIFPCYEIECLLKTNI